MRTVEPSDWCPYKKRTFRQRDIRVVCTKERPCEDTGRRSGKRPRKKPSLLTP